MAITPKFDTLLGTIRENDAPGVLATVAVQYMSLSGETSGQISGDYSFAQSIVVIQEADINGALYLGFQAPFNMQDGYVIWKSTTPASVGSPGAGTRFQWDPLTASLSVGLATGTEWNATNLGYYSYAFGQSVQMSSNSSFGAGSALLVPVGSDNVIALGDNTTLDNNSPNVITIGSTNNITNSNSTQVIGGGHTITGNNNATVGLYTTINGTFNYAFGYQNSITGGVSNSIALGSNNTITNNFGSAVGYGNSISASSGVAIGLSNTASGFQSTAIGSVVVSSAAKAVTLGAAITNSIINSFAFGISGKYFHVRGGSVTRAGTVSTTSGSNVVTGVGTSFQNAFIPGDRITIGTETYSVQTIPSATSLTVSSNYTTTNAAGTLYIILPAISAYYRKSDGKVTQLIRDDGFMFVGASATPYPLSVLDVQGSFATPIITVTASTTLDATMQMVMVNAIGATTITLPDARLCSGREYDVKELGIGAITVTAVFGNIDGSATDTITALNSCKTYKSDGTNYYIKTKF